MTKAERDVMKWNDAVKVGDLVEFQPIMGLSEGTKQYRTRTQAQVLSGHSAVVWLEGKSGCVLVSHCRPSGPAREVRDDL